MCSNKLVHSNIVEVDTHRTIQTKVIFFQPTGGKDIAFGSGLSWKYHRKLFSTSLRQYLTDIPMIESRIHEQAERLLTFIGEQDSKPFDPEHILAMCICDVICGITFGKYFNSSYPQFQAFLGILDEALELELDADMFVLDMFSVAKYLPLETYKRNQRITDRIFGVLRQVLKNREKDYDVSDPVNDFMTALLKVRHEAEIENDKQAKEFLTEDYLLNSILDMFSAGYETTTTTLKWTILFLVNYPQYQTEIQDALDKVFI
ncbi:hypothetical protein QZH41_006464 [Actinostola sp. cb2023]|nr:hypothetical protein QZH41_006464 [Actinostola sp. cb2023]